ncbi:MAG TPA: hypothetical protein VGI64_14795 [Streptosporangiaceae bacterium]
MTVLASSSSAFDQPGTLGFLVVAGIGVILVFLFRSMTKHLRKVSGTGRGGPSGQQEGPARAVGKAGHPVSPGAERAARQDDKGA